MSSVCLSETRGFWLFCNLPIVCLSCLYGVWLCDCPFVCVPSKRASLCFDWTAQEASHGAGGGGGVRKCVAEILAEFYKGLSHWFQPTPAESDRGSINILFITLFPYTLSRIYGGYLLYKVSFNLFAIFRSLSPWHTHIYTRASLWVRAWKST